MRNIPEMEEKPGFAVASAIVYSKPGQAQLVRTRLLEMPGVEVHAIAGDGKLVVTIDRDSETETIDTLSKMETIEDVVTATLVYHYCDNS